MSVVNLNVGVAEKKEIEPLVIPETTSTVPSTLFYTLHKAGGVYFWGCIRRLAMSAGMPGINLSAHYFKLGYGQEEFPQEVKDAFKPIGYCYGPFRSLNLPFDIPDYDKFRKLLIVRDPRDILTSHYFSNKFSHPRKPPKPGETETNVKRTKAEGDIDSYVIHFAPRFVTRFEDYQRFVTKADIPVFRYEDIIDNFETWLHEVAKAMCISPRPKAIKLLLDNHVTGVEQEDVKLHRRQIRPGDHLRKLKPETIETLSKMFEEPLKFFKYS